MSAASPGTTADQAGARRRVTRQRAAVSAQMAGAVDFRSAQSIYADLRTAGNSIGLATVYRALQGMVEDGEVDVLRSADDGEAVYRRCSTGHHHHLVCRSCGLATEVEGAEAERWAQAVAAEHGFTEVSHVLEVFGTCAACSARPPGPAQVS
jgi:Fur family ferric uptake transcriptional regulator